MVHGGDHGQAAGGDAQQPGAQTLVVVDDVELVAALREQSGGAQAERARLGEARGPHGGELQHVDAVADLAGARHAERIGLAVEVKAGHLGQPDPGIENLGVGLAGEDLDVMTQFDQPAAEVPNIDALSAAVCLAAIGQQRNPHTHAPAMPTTDEDGLPARLAYVIV